MQVVLRQLFEVIVAANFGHLGTIAQPLTRELPLDQVQEGSLVTLLEYESAHDNAPVELDVVVDVFVYLVQWFDLPNLTNQLINCP
jgi:hypothetical protein